MIRLLPKRLRAVVAPSAFIQPRPSHALNSNSGRGQKVPIEPPVGQPLSEADFVAWMNQIGFSISLADAPGIYDAYCRLAQMTKPNRARADFEHTSDFLLGS